MKKKVFSVLIALLLVFSVLQVRAPIANADSYSITLNISPDSGTKGNSVTISFSGMVTDKTSGLPVSGKKVYITAYCLSGSPSTSAYTNPNGYYSGTITGTVSQTGNVTASYSGASASKTFTASNSPLSVSLSASSTSVVTNESVSFTASASGGSGGYSYSWTGLGSGYGSGSSATGKWSSAGSKTVRVTVTDSSGNTATDSVTVSVHSMTASISGPSSGNTNTSYTFTCSASGSSGYSYSWSGGGSPSSGSGSSFTTSWSSAGSKTVYCTVTDSYGNTAQASHSITITAQNNLSVSVSASSTSVSTGTQVTLTAYPSGGSSPYSYNWYGGGVSGSSQTVYHSWSSAGSYTVYCKVTDSSGNTATGSVTITVTSSASIDSFTSSPYSDSNNPLSPGTQVTLSWSTTGINYVYLYEGSNYVGEYPGNSSTNVTPGSTVTYTIKDADDTSISKSVTVYVASSSDYTVSEELDPSSGIAGQTVSLTVSGTIRKGGALNSSNVDVRIDASSLGLGMYTCKNSKSNYSHTFTGTLPSTAGKYAVKVYIGSTQENSQDFTVNANKKDTVLTLSKTNINITQGNSTTLTATLKDKDGNPVTGVSLNVSTNTSSSNIDAYAEGSTNNNGQTTIHINVDSSCPAGSYTLTVSFGGNSGYNSSSATATINVSQATTLDYVTLSANNTNLEGGNSTDLYAHAYDTKGNDITSQVTFSWSKNSNKGTLSPLYSGSSQATYTSDVDSYSVTITVQGALNGVTKTASVTITVDSTTLVASMQNKISDIQSGGSHEFSVKVLYGSTDVTDSSTITWSATKGTLSSSSGKSVTWTAPTVTSNEDATIKVTASYTENGVTKTSSDICEVTIKAIQKCTLTVANYPSGTPSGDTAGTLYYDDIDGTQESVPVQGDGAQHSFYPQNARLTLTVTNPFNFNDPNWASTAPYEWNCDGLTGQSVRMNKSTYTYDPLTGDTHITANYFRKLHISASIKEDNGNIVVTYSAFGGPYPTPQVSTKVDISKIDLHIKQGDNPTATWNMNPDTVTLNGSSKSQSISKDNLGLKPGTYTIYAKVTGNIDNWAANGDTTYTNSITVTIYSSLYVGDAEPQTVHENDSSNPHEHKTDILIETLDKNGNPIKMSKPSVTIDGSGDLTIWSENGDQIHWHATWYPGSDTGSEQGTVHYFTVNGKVKRPVTVYSKFVPPPYTITIQGFHIDNTSVDSTSDPNYVYVDVSATMSVVTWYTGSSDNSTSPPLKQVSQITITSDLIDKEDGNITIGSDKFNGTADTKGLYSSGSDPGYPNKFTVHGAIPMSDLTSGSGQKEEGAAQKNSIQLLSVRPVTGGVAVKLKVNGNTVQRTLILTGSATRTDANDINKKYNGKVSATDQATDTTTVSINVPSGTGTVIVHKTVTYGDGTTEPLPNVEFTLTDANGKTYTDTTDNSGTITFSNIPVGSATVTETVPSGYTNDSPSQTVTVQKGQSVQVDFTNYPVGAIIHIHKYNDDNGNGKEDPGEAAAGITFNITSPNGGSYTVTTDSNGDAYQKVTVADTYTITEQVPSGYAAENNPQSVTITKADLTSGTTKTVVFVDVKSNGTIIVKKFKDLNGNGVWDSGEPPMAGIAFSISNSEHSYSGTTDSTGTYTQTVVPGTYTVTETVPAGYTAEPSASQTVTVASGESKTVVFGNKPADKKAEIDVFKFYDADGDGTYDPGAGDSPMSGVSFSLSGPETQSGTTDSTGHLVFTVTHTGTYTVTESVPSGYTAENNPQSVTITQSDLDNNATKNLTFANKKKQYQIIVYKFEDKNGNGVWDSGEPPMSGVTFTCQNSNLTLIATTDSNGKAEFDLADSGTYTVTESVPSGYEVTTQNPVVVTLSDSNPTSVINFGNKPTSAVLKIYVWDDINGNGKIDQGESGVGGVTVSVSGTNYTTNSSGYIYVSVDKAGTFDLVETVPSGWTATTPTNVQVTFTQDDISNGTTKEADFGIKTDQGTLEIHKFIDYNGNGTQDTGEPPQANVAFEIKGNNYDKTFVTDSSGNIVVSLPVGTYTVTESVPSGYTAENNPQSADITKDNTTTLTFANKPQGCTIHIHKFVDTNGNGSQDAGEKDQSGVAFSIKLPNGSVANVTTDASGNATYIAKEPGTYTITEQVPNGYTAENGTQSVTVSSTDLTGGNKYLIFANKPEGKTIVIFKFNDKNKNGVQDTGEGPLAGVTFTVTGPNNFSKTVTTDSSGNASVTVKDTGTYTITEQVPNGYECTTQNPVTVNITNNSPDTIQVTFGDYSSNAATIHIFKFVDINGNGVQDGNDAGQAGVTFTVTGPNNFSKTVTTDSTGNIYFNVNTPGTYTVTESVPSGYTAENPTQQISVTQSDIDNKNTLSLTFANQPSDTDVLVIHKYRDMNGNGQIDNADKPEAGVHFTITDLDTGLTYTAVTNSSGIAEVTVAVPKTGTRKFSVHEEVPSGETVISSNPQMVTYYSDDGFDSEPRFLNSFSGTVINIHKYNDDNGNGKEDPGEAASGITFTVTGPNNFSKTVTTDSSGNASVTVKDTGTYTITEQVPNGYKAETNPQTVTVTSSDITNHTAKNVTFVDLPSGEAIIKIYKFVDLNGNGVQDTADSGQAGVTFTVTDPNNFSKTVTTNAGGYAQVIVSAPGTYTVKETVPNNYTPTTSTTQTVSFTKNDIVNKTTKQLTFGNHPNTRCVTDGTTEPQYVITFAEASDQYNKITIIVHVGSSEDPLFYPGATSANITIPQEEGMQSGVNNATMTPQGLADKYGCFHTFTYTWYDVEDPNVVADGTIRQVYVHFHNAVFGDQSVGCTPDISYVVKNPNHHVGGSAVTPIIQSLKHIFVSLKCVIMKTFSYVFNSPPFAFLHKRALDKLWMSGTIRTKRNALIAL